MYIYRGICICIYKYRGIHIYIYIFFFFLGDSFKLLTLQKGDRSYPSLPQEVIFEVKLCHSNCLGNGSKRNEVYIWSNYSDLGPQKVAEKGKSPAISGKSRLVKYYNFNLARYMDIGMHKTGDNQQMFVKSFRGDGFEDCCITPKNWGNDPI